MYFNLSLIDIFRQSFLSLLHYTKEVKELESQQIISLWTMFDAATQNMLLMCLSAYSKQIGEQ